MVRNSPPRPLALNPRLANPPGEVDFFDQEDSSASDQEGLNGAYELEKAMSTLSVSSPSLSLDERVFGKTVARDVIEVSD